MKRILFFIAILSILMGCKKTSYVAVFDKSPQERAAEQINLVYNTLTGAPDGWVGTLPTLAGGGYGFYFTFDKDQNVTMYGDLTSTSAATVGKSNFRIKQDMGTELVFDTYNYISMLDDPNAAILGGVSKVGFSSDIEFTFDRINGDSIIFIGKKYRQPFKLVKATAAQKTAYSGGSIYPSYINSIKGFFSKNANTYISLADGTLVNMAIDHSNSIPAGKTIKANAQQGTVPLSASAKYAITIDQMPILNNGLTIAGITFVKILMKAPNSFVIVDNKGTEYPFQRVEVPVKTVIETRNPTFILPDATTFPGWSTDFSARRAIANTSTGRWSNGGALRLEKVTLQNFNITAKTLLIKVYTARIADGVVPGYTFDMNYTFSFINDNTIKFNWVAGVDANGTNFHNTDMPSLLGQRIDVDSFKMDYFTDTATGNIYARFSSIEHPDFVFTVSF